MQNLATEIELALRKFYPQLAEQQLQEDIKSIGQIYHFQEGEIIMDINAYVRMVPLVIKGSIKVVREDEEGKELFLYYLLPGDTCSMSFTCCMMNKKSQIRTIAEENTTFIGIPIQKMDEWMTNYQSWKNFVMKTYDDRMMEMVRTIDSIAFKRMDERLMDYLYKKAEATKSNILHATHQEIAYDLNASREAISRLLKQLERSGQVVLGRNRVQLVEG